MLYTIYYLLYAIYYRPPLLPTAASLLYTIHYLLYTIHYRPHLLPTAARHSPPALSSPGAGERAEFTSLYYYLSLTTFTFRTSFRSGRQVRVHEQSYVFQASASHASLPRPARSTRTSPRSPCASQLVSFRVPSYYYNYCYYNYYSVPLTTRFPPCAQLLL